VRARVALLQSLQAVESALDRHRVPIDSQDHRPSRISGSGATGGVSSEVELR
jgi:hypothetical protein